MTCESALKALPLLVYGELSFEDEERIEQHLEGCALCREELTRIRAMHVMIDSTELEPDAELLGACRRNLRGGVTELAERGVRRGAGGWVREFFAPAWMKPAGAVALLVVGFAGGRQATLVTQAGGAASAAPVVSRVRYVEPEGAGQVRMLVDETRQRVLTGRMEEDGIRNLLLAAARESSDPALRVESVELLKASAHSDEVRRALLHALEHDPNPGVRVKALEGLRASAEDPTIRKALARTLLRDDHPDVRTQAIDLLVLKREPEMVGVLQELVRREESGYVRSRCQKVLHEMRASVEAF